MKRVQQGGTGGGKNRRTLAVFFTTICISVAGVFDVTAGEKIGPRLASELGGLTDDAEVLAWVYFTDKGSLEHMRNSVPDQVVSPRSIQRRLKVRSMESVVDYTDLAVEEEYVRRVRSGVLAVRHRSKWFNAVSVRATKGQIGMLEHLPFVRQIDLLARFRRDEMNDVPANEPLRQDESQSVPQGTEVLDYGPSFTQNNQINVVTVHNTGNYAQGVVVGVFDNGFRLLNHEAFDALDIIATYDFVDHKVSVVPNNPDPSFGAHGIYTLSTIAGYTSGELIGPAFGASFILARTENDSSETPIEEDNWAAAIEWADSIGVDVTSTSLGYSLYDPPYNSWTWQDMDGNTTVITRAADMAVARGIVVVNSAGNSGSNSSHNTLVAPADGDSVIAVGAVSSSGGRASFSSVGPTTSTPPRIKPDVMAMGVSTHCASAISPGGYTYVSGTSLSCPLAAGVAALVVSARPTATPVEVADAMRMTASNAGSPDNQYGWGILDAAGAIDYLSGGSGIACEEITSMQGRCVGSTSFTLQFRINLLNSTIHAGEIVSFDVDGTPYDAAIFTNGTHSRAQVIVSDVAAGSHTISLTDPPGCVDPIVVSCGTAGKPEADRDQAEELWKEIADGVMGITPSTRFLGNYPNPFNPSTTFRYVLSENTHVTLRVYDMLGQLVKTVVNDFQAEGFHEAVWDGRNESGAGVSGGVYMYRMTAGRFTDTGRMLLLK